VGEADVISVDGKLAAAAIEEHGQFDTGWASEIGQFIKGGPDGAAGVKDVVEEDDLGTIDIEVDG
jgi:hypothetical protein